MITHTAMEFIKKKLCEGERLDDRKLKEYREIVIERGVGENAEGSARVKIGQTEVIAGIKMQVGEPFKDTPNEGILITSAEFMPFSSSEVEPGPPTVDEIELGRVIDRGIREGKVIDLEKLCIVEGEKVWTIFVDIYLVNDDGNMYDASSLAVMNALMDVKIPKLDENYEIIEGEFNGKLPIRHKVVSLTAYKVGNVIFYDPNAKEEEVVDARLTAGIRDDGKIVSLQKGMEGSFKYDEIIPTLRELKERGLEFIGKYVQ